MNFKAVLDTQNLYLKNKLDANKIFRGLTNSHSALYTMRLHKEGFGRYNLSDDKLYDNFKRVLETNANNSVTLMESMIARALAHQNQTLIDRFVHNTSAAFKYSQNATKNMTVKDGLESLKSATSDFLGQSYEDINFMDQYYFLVYANTGNNILGRVLVELMTLNTDV